MLQTLSPTIIIINAETPLRKNNRKIDDKK